jgi:hypothetical protein
MPPIWVFAGPPPKKPESKVAVKDSKAINGVRARTASASTKSAQAPAGKGAITHTAQAVASGGPFVPPELSGSAHAAGVAKLPSRVPLPRPRPKI